MLDKHVIARLCENQDFIVFMQYVCHQIVKYKKPNKPGNAQGEVSTINMTFNAGMEAVYGEIREFFPRKTLIDIEYPMPTENDRLGDEPNYERTIRTRVNSKSTRNSK